MRFTGDFFSGLLMGNFPFYSEYAYRANVNSFQLTGSTNVTFNFHVEFMNIVKFDLEMDFVPISITGGLRSYATSALEDNCMWIFGNLGVLQLNTRLTKTFARCGRNLRDMILDSRNLSDLMNNL